MIISHFGGGGGGESMWEIEITLGSVNVHSYHMCVVYPMLPTFDM